MKAINGTDRRFLFLQGPHGPFFDRLGKLLRSAGSEVWRVGFNAGDQAFWLARGSYIAFVDQVDDWPDRLATILAEHKITDIVMYGDTRPIHQLAREQAATRNITVHVFEEGYIRPFWATYERGGANGHSKLMQTSVAQIRAVLSAHDQEPVEAPSHWGDMREHMFYGALYHWFVLARNRAYPGFRPHRQISVAQEFRVNLRNFLLMPLNGMARIRDTLAVKSGGFPYHLALLQLEHDASFRDHSPFTTMSEFLEVVIHGFAEGAPPHHHLVFKSHPLEDGRLPLRSTIRRMARAQGIADRVHFVRGGKLASLLDGARSAVTINSTAGQQALWRGLPLRIFGAAVYAKPEFVSDQPLPEFFANPTRPDLQSYLDFRQYLLETSQVSGGYYSARARRQLLRQVVDMMLEPLDPYDALENGTAAPRQQLTLVK